MEKQIFAIGGGATPEPVREHLLGLTGRERPKVLLVPTASGEDPAQTLRIYDAYGGRAELSRVEFFPWPPENLRDYTLAHDLIVVGGGNTANMLAIWRVHGFDEILREAYERGVVLAGSSAGMICWFEAGVTDSFGPQLAGFARRPRLPPRQRVPALRRRGPSPPDLPAARRRGLPAGLRRRHRRRPPLRRR
jgi:dipeptidase E